MKPLRRGYLAAPAGGLPALSEVPGAKHCNAGALHGVRPGHQSARPAALPDVFPSACFGLDMRKSDLYLVGQNLWRDPCDLREDGRH